jgi:PAS domain S-box-containing protein
MTTLLGHDVSDLLGANPIGLVHPDDQAEATMLLGGLLQGVDVVTPAQVRFQHADGHWRYIEADGVNMLENPSVSGIVDTARDINERKHFE